MVAFGAELSALGKGRFRKSIRLLALRLEPHQVNREAADHEHHEPEHDPQRLRGAEVPAWIAVRGEAYVRKADFLAYNRAAEESGRVPRPPLPGGRGELSVPLATCLAGCRIAWEVGARSIVVFTQSGFSARQAARFRPRTPLLAFAAEPKVAEPTVEELAKAKHDALVNHTLRAREREKGEALVDYRGDRESMRDLEPILSSCLLTAMRQEEETRRPIAAYATVGVLLLALAGWLGYGFWLDSRAQQANAAIAAMPGVVVTDFERDGRAIRIAGLRDRLAADPAGVAVSAGWSGDVVADFRPFLSLDDELVALRAAASLEPPEGVALAVSEGEQFK